jgi:hypothetical protein
MEILAGPHNAVPGVDRADVGSSTPRRAAAAAGREECGTNAEAREEARSRSRAIARAYSGESSYSPSARLSKRVHWRSNRTFAVPVGPFRCFAMMSSAMFGSAESSRL